MNDISKVAGTAAEKPVVIPIEAYVSEAYARAENDKLWAKVWQVHLPGGRDPQGRRLCHL